MQTSNDIYYLIKDLLLLEIIEFFFLPLFRAQFSLLKMMIYVHCVSFLTRAVLGRFFLRKISIFRRTSLRRTFDTVRRLENTAP